MSKRIIYCTDGTWNDPATNTNVYKIFKAMNYTAAQCPMYDDGVGADGSEISKLLGGAFGEGLDQKIMDGYTRISHLYEHGDQIFLFGFSRGAYTARSLAGMIATCGLPTQNVDDNLTASAFQAYRQRIPAIKQQQLAALKKTYAIEDANIVMVGVWDTVGSLGIPAAIGDVDPLRYGFCDTSLHPCIKNAYHAISIDERRREFPATLWSGTPAAGQTIEQVYFTGVHCDVGGGYPETGLSDITLSWMMGKAQALGVDFNPAVYQTYENLDAKHALDLKHESWSVKWGFPEIRPVANNAAVSNSVQIRLQQDNQYQPTNLTRNATALATGYSVVSVVTMKEAATASAAGAAAGQD